MLEILLYAGRAIMPLLLTMALGCWLRRSAHWSDDFYRQLNSFCFHVLLPVQLFLNVYAIEDLSVLNWRLLGFIVLCVVGAAGLGVAVAPLFARERAQQVVIAQATFRANQVIMGIPLASALGGQDALIFASLVTSVCVPVFNMLAVLMLTAYSTDGKSISWREEVRQIFRNPLILGALAGLVTVLVRQLLPQVDGQPVFSLRSRLRFDAVQGLWKKILAAVSMRLVVVPTIVLTLVLLLREPLGLTTVEMPTIVAIFCSPVAVTSAVMVQEIGGDEQLAQQVVAWSSVLSMGTIFCFAAALRAMGVM